MDFTAPTLGGAVKAVLLPHLQDSDHFMLIKKMWLKYITYQS